ncbi:TIGR02265 family protein [Myxococcaceae bacterium GXIMD 01537]
MTARPQPRPEQRVVFASVVEGLLRHGLQGRVSPRLRERLRQAGLDLDRPLLPAYPVPMWAHCLGIIAEEAYPGMPAEEAFRRLAEQHVEGYGNTLFGRAVYRVMRLLGPRRMVLRLPQTLRGTDNYTEADLVEVGPACFEMRVNSVMEWPGYAESLFEAFLRMAGAEDPRVAKVGEVGGSTTYRLSWTER